MAWESAAAFWGVSLLFVLTPGADWAYAIAAGLRHRSVLPSVMGLLVGHLVATAVVAAGVAALVAGSPVVMTVLTAAGALYLVWMGIGALRSAGAPAQLPLTTTATTATAVPTTGRPLSLTSSPIHTVAAASAPVLVPGIGPATGPASGPATAADTVHAAGAGVDDRTPHATMLIAHQRVVLETPWWRQLTAGAGVSGLNPKVFLLFLALLPQFTDPTSAWPVATQIVALGLVHVASCAVVYTAVGIGARTVLRARPGAARVVTRISGAAMVVIGVALLVERLAVHA